MNHLAGQTQTTGKAIQVLVVDDSALVRTSFRRMIADCADMELMAAVPDPHKAAEVLREQLPDVMVLDIEMPKMDGLTFLEKIMEQRPLPVVICSTLATGGSRIMFSALELGALEVITKPQMGTRKFLEESSTRILDALRAAARARLPRPGKRDPDRWRVAGPKSKDALSSGHLTRTTDKVIALGASTGGTEAIRQFLQALNPDVPGVVIVQHMPEHFTRSFAQRLNDICPLRVKEAEAGDTVMNGRALIAPGNRHMILRRSGGHYQVDLLDGPLVNRHRPAVDVLFRSVAKNAGENAIGVLLTGMGKDGAAGLKEMKEVGAFNIAQDEESSVVYGMPKAAVDLDAVSEVLPLREIARKIMGRARIL